jgi:hypothetical protein
MARFLSSFFGTVTVRYLRTNVSSMLIVTDRFSDFILQFMTAYCPHSCRYGTKTLGRPSQSRSHKRIKYANDSCEAVNCHNIRAKITISSSHNEPSADIIWCNCITCNK